MKWLKYSLETTTEAADLVIDLLAGLGIYGVEIIDNVPLTDEEKKQMYVDILPENAEDDGRAELCFYVEEAADAESRAAFYNSGTGIEEAVNISSKELIEKIKEGLDELSAFADIGTGRISISETGDEDWADKWKEFFKPFRIGKNIVVSPTWEEPTDIKADDIIIKIDPGVAFGTGAHETTRLCVEELEEYVTENSEMLDIGCGSAILTIAALKLGARKAYAIDIDPTAVKTAKENLVINGVEEAVRVEAGNLLEDEELRNELYKQNYDIIAANILAPVLVSLTPLIVPALKDGGYYICSGIVEELSEEVIRAIHEAGLNLVSESHDGDWVCLVARK